MPAYNFQRRFAPLIRQGVKRSTIRRRRKDGRDAKAGETLYLFTGMRTKKCTRLLETRCEKVSRIRIRQYERSAHAKIDLSRRRLLAGDPLLTSLWQNEGFDSLKDMLAWFRKNHGLSFSGLLIEW